MDHLTPPSLITFLQIKDIGLTLNPRAGERAVLIKNHAGDWGLVTGKWTGFRKGVPGIKGRTFLYFHVYLLLYVHSKQL